MVFYIEACESGSMFENLLPDNINGKYIFGSKAELKKYFFKSFCNNCS